MIQHQQIPEGDAFVEPRDQATVVGLLAAAEELGLDASVVRTQMGGYLAPVDVVAKWQEGDVGDDVVVTEVNEALVVPEPAAADDGDDGRPADSAKKDDWVAYAQTQGYDDSEGLTKSELIERFGASE